MQQIQPSGFDCIEINIFLRLYLGNQSYTISVEGEDINFSIKINFTVEEESRIITTFVRKDYECDRAENDLEDGSLRIIVSNQHKSYEEDYYSVSGKRKINMFVEEEIKAGDQWEIWFYYERQDRERASAIWNNGGTGWSLKKNYGFNSDYLNDSTYWSFLIDFNDGVLEATSIPFTLEYKTGDELHEISITVSFLKTEIRETSTFNDLFDDISLFIPTITNNGGGQLENKVSIVLTILTNVGMIIAVLMSAFMGVKYMLGSAEEKADYKKDMIPYLVGAILTFGICTVVKVLQAIGQNINNI